jgi:hypothetical protein
MSKQIIGMVAVTFLIISLVAFTFVLVNGLEWQNGTPGENQEKIICSGNIAVPLLGIGSTTLENVNCGVQECSWYQTLSIFSEEGTIKLFVDGKVLDTATWKSTLGTNQKFTLESSCVANPQSATIQLYDDNNLVLDSTQVNFQ